MKNTKILGRKSYGSIPHLLSSKLGEGDHHIHQGQHNILTKKARDRHDTIYVTEKYDGSNVSIAKISGKILALTRSGYEAKSSQHKTHHLFSVWVKRNISMLHSVIPNNTRLCCEWLEKRHSLSYLYLNNTQDNISNKRLSYTNFYSMDTGAIAKARLIHVGSPAPAVKLKNKLNIKDCNHKIICEQQPEGMVYRCERKDEFDFMAKWVRSDFVAGKYLDKKAQS